MTAMTYVLVALVTIASPLWVPILFVCYAIVQKRFSLAFLILLVTAEAISLGAAQLALSVLSGYMRQD
jgi:hypothetical protein